MKSRVIIAAVLGLVVVLLAWNVLFYSPAGDDLDEARTDRDALVDQIDDLQAHLERLLDQQKNQPEVEAERARLAAMVPDAADLQVFIRSANKLSFDSGLDWISIAPSEPTPGSSGIAQINMTIQLEGGYYQVLDYLNRMEDLLRIVVIDSIQVSAGGSDPGGGSTATTAPASVTGAPTLQVNLTARMFTLQQGVVATPTVPVEPGGDATTTTVAGATTETSAGGTN